MPVCPNCHTPLPFDANFCTACGSPIPASKPAPVILPMKLPEYSMTWHRIYSGFLLPLFTILSLLAALLCSIGLPHLFAEIPEDAPAILSDYDTAMLLLFLTLTFLLPVLRRKLRRKRFDALAFHNTLLVILSLAQLIGMDLQRTYYSAANAFLFPSAILLISLVFLLVNTLYYKGKRKIYFTA